VAQITNTVATLPVTNRANGTHSTPTRAVPAGFDYVEVDVNCTSGNVSSPFTGFAHPFSKTTMAVTFGVQWSWDGGATFPQSTEGMVTGQPTGVWATDRHTGLPVMTPSVGLSAPGIGDPSVPPTHYRAYMTVAGGPITFGITVQETTG
jgi:hypothetical protein